MSFTRLRKVILALVCLSVLAGSAALAQKKGGGGSTPTPAPGTIYFLNWSGAGLGWKMNGDGSGKAQTIEGQPSYQRHGGSRWFLQNQYGDDILGDWGQWFAVDENGGTVQLTNDPDLRTNGYPPSWAKDDSFFSYAGVYETEEEWIGRLFVVEIDWLEDVPVAGPPTIVFEIRRSVFDEWGEWSYEGYDEVNLGSHDWSPLADEAVLTRWVWGEGWVLDIVRFSDEGLEIRSLVSRAAKPVWSPDGGRIAFNREERSGYQEIQEIWTIRPDGSDAVRLTEYVSSKNGERGQLLPTWSPDGAYLAYTERVVSGNKTTHDILRVPAGGGTPTSLTGDGKSSWPRWRP